MVARADRTYKSRQRLVSPQTLVHLLSALLSCFLAAPHRGRPVAVWKIAGTGEDADVPPLPFFLLFLSPAHGSPSSEKKSSQRQSLPSAAGEGGAPRALSPECALAVVGERAAVDGSREGALRLAPMRGSFSPRLCFFFLSGFADSCMRSC